MELMLLRSFQRQILLQCKFVMQAAGEMNRGMDTQNVTYIFYAAQNLLNAAANISKALWGSGGEKAAARKPIRDSVGIGDDSPLRDVVMRNNYEHFDERLEKWWDEYPAHN